MGKHYNSPSITLPVKVAPIGPVEIKLSRQQLRALGRREARQIVDYVVQTKEGLTRQQRREIMRQEHQRAWQSRDRELVAKVMKGFTPVNA